MAWKVLFPLETERSPTSYPRPDHIVFAVFQDLVHTIVASKRLEWATVEGYAKPDWLNASVRRM